MNAIKPTLPANVQKAIEKTVGLNESAKKWEPLAAHLGMTEGVLRNKVARGSEDKRHHLSLAEAIEIVKMTKDHTLIHALCTEFNGEFLIHPDIKGSSDEELLTRYTGMMMELGKFSTDIHDSLMDGQIDQNEINKLRSDFLCLSGALSEIMERLQDRAKKDECAKKANVERALAQFG